MHAEALAWVAEHAPAEPSVVIDCGGRDINGNPRHLFHADSLFEVVDLYDGPGVTWQGDVLDYTSDDKFDVALCLEVAEHTKDWRKIVAHLADLLRPGGVFIFTAAGPDRVPHSALDGGPLRDGEFYENIHRAALVRCLDKHFADTVIVDELGADIRAVAVK